MDAYIKDRSFRDTLYGQVSYGMHRASGRHVIIKDYSKWQIEQRVTREGLPVAEDAKEEIRLHAYLCSPQPHPHLVQIYDVQEDAKTIYTILEYCAKGEIFEYIKRQVFSPIDVNRYFKQLLIGVAYMHTRGVAHLDLSLENLLLDEQDQLKICDFGVAIQCAPQTLLNTTDKDRRPGKAKYMAPEIFNFKPYDPYLCDSWSVGVILFVMLCGGFPYDAPVLLDARFKLIYTGQLQTLVTAWSLELPAHAVSVLSCLLSPASQRWTVARVLAEHPYVTDMNEIKMTT